MKTPFYIGTEELLIKAKQGEQGIQGEPGKDAINGRDGKDSVVPGPKGDKGDRGEHGKNGKDGSNGSSDTPEQILAKLESLLEHLDYNKLKNLPELYDPTNNPQGIGGGANALRILNNGTSVSDFINSIDFGGSATYSNNGKVTITSGSSGAIITATDSGDHKNFTLAQAPTTSNYYIIFNDGIYLPTNDTFPFSIVSTTLTFTSTLPSDMVGKLLTLVCI